jgi:hypothetical protein
VKSAKAAERVMGSVRHYVERKLGLIVNQTKSKCGPLTETTVASASLRPAGSLPAGCLPAVGSRVPNQCPGKSEMERESAPEVQTARA